MGCNACNSVYRVPLLSLLEALLKWLQKGGKGCGMCNVNRLKLFKRQMYGRAQLDLLRQRVLYLA